MEDNEQSVIEFPECPVCRSPRRFVGELAKESKPRGLIPENMEFFSHVIEGVAAMPDRLQRALVGTTVPSYRIFIDVCADCGAIYAPKIVRGAVRVSVQRAPPNLSGPISGN